LSGFWILADWPHGSTALILGAVATARLATMAPAVPIAVAATLIFSISAIPAFIVIDVILPSAQGFATFAMVVGPMLFLCALLMGKRKPLWWEFLSAYFLAPPTNSKAKMIYARVALTTPSTAAVTAAVPAVVLWAIVAPQTPEAARRRFVRAART